MPADQTDATVTVLNPDPREIALEGIVNFRDLGGLVNRDGQRVRQGRLFRSDALHTLTAVDVDRLAGLHIQTLIDLRTETEVARSGPSPLVHRGTRVVRAQVFDADPALATIADTPLAVHYADYLAHGMAAFRTIFTTIDDAEQLPAVIHCAAGKDRTGVSVALLYRVLGIPDSEIVADYAITDRNMQRMIAGWRKANPAMANQEITVPAHLVRAVPETMETFLASLDATWGSAEEYLLKAGLTATQLDSLRSALLEPAS